MDDVRSMVSAAPSAAATAARQAAWLFALSGVFALAAVPVEPRRAGALLVIGIADVVVGSVIACLPWHAWPGRATLGVVAPALGVVAGSHALGLVPARSYGVFFVLILAWVGSHHVPFTTLKLSPVMAVGYMLPITVTHAEPTPDPRALVLAIGVGVLVGETISRSVTTSSRARARADRAARTFATVGRATSELVYLDADAIVDAVVDTVVELGYDGANLAIVDRGRETFQLGHGRGIAVALSGHRFPTTAGLTGQVLRSGEPIVIDDYQTTPVGIPALQPCGARTAIGVPVLDDGEIVAVLMAMYTDVRATHAEDIEALRIVAAHAGAAFNALRRLEAEQQRSEVHARAAMIDPLTGIGNRRRSDQILHDVVEGDAIALIDIDRFKTINDTYGHDGGDQLLRDLAGFVATNLRADDHVARYGGEEFLIVLPSTPIEEAGQLLERLRSSWNATNPLASFSSGTATHDAGDTSAATLRRADAALYRAKAEGRDRVCTAAPLGRSHATGA